jgi:hypothetical protein
MIFEAIIIGSGLLAFSALVITSRILTSKRRARCMEKFSDYQGILEYFMEKAFQIVYKDRVMTYSLEATRPRESEIDAISTDFIRLTQKFLGPMIQSELIFMYGGEEAFAANLLDYFNTHYEEDEIRKSALARMQEAEEET